MLSEEKKISMESLYDTIQYLKNLLEEKINQVTSIGEWIPEYEAMRISGLSRGTLLKLRKQGKLSSSTLSGKQNFYRVKDFEQLLNENEQLR